MQKRICFRRVERRHFEREILGGRVAEGVDAGGKQSVGECLREHVGKHRFGEVGDEDLPEGGEPLMQPTRFGFLLERGDALLPERPRVTGHAVGQFFRRGDRQRRFLEKRG